MARKKRITASKSSQPKEEYKPLTSETTSGKKNRLVMIVVVLILLGAALYLVKQWFVVALVNGQPIARLKVVQELEKQGGKRVLDSLIVQELIRQEAKKKNVQVSQSDVDASIKKLEESFKAEGQTIDQILSLQGMTRKDLEDQMKIQITLEKLLGNKVAVTEKEIDQYLTQTASETTMEVVTTPTPTPSRESVREQLKQQKLQEEAQKLIEELRKNAKINQFVVYQ